MCVIGAKPMNAIQFIKDNGVERARKLAFDQLHPQMTHVTDDGRHWINVNHPNSETDEDELKDMIVLIELKRFVASVDAVRGFGGLGMAKLINQTEFSDYSDLTQAIADFESLGGGHV